MPERSSVSQGVQIGVESTYGTAVTANKRFAALQIVPSPDLSFERFRGAGNKFNSVAALTQRSTAVDIPDSPLTYTEVIYPFSSLFGAATITQPDVANAPTVYQHEYVVSATGADSPVSFTVQRGDGTLRETFAGFVVNSLDIAMAIGEGVTMTGDGFGGAMEHAAGVMDAISGTQPSLIPVLPTQISVYMDDLPATPSEASIDAAFGTTKLTRVFEANPSFGNRYSRVYALDAAQAGSSVAVVEVPVEFAVDLAMEADATGWGLMAAAEAGTAKLIRIEAIGGIAEDAIPYTVTLDFFGRIADGGDTEDRDGVEQISWTMDMMYDSTWDKAMRVRVINTTSGL